MRVCHHILEEVAVVAAAVVVHLQAEGHPLAQTLAVQCQGMKT